MNTPEILIHPGFHKTGTTFLQEAVFSDADLFDQPWKRADIGRILIEPHDLHFNPASARSELDSLAQGRGNKVAVLSEEGLSGSPLTGARESSSLAHRLAAVFPHARILLTTRLQASLLRSVYVQYLKESGRRRPEEFLSPPRLTEFPGFDAATFAFDHLVRLYADLFGKENVLVLPQELLRGDERAFLAELSRFSGLPRHPRTVMPEQGQVNVSPSLGNAAYFRLANRFLRGPFNEMGSGRIGLPIGLALRSLAYKLPVRSTGDDGVFRRFAEQMREEYEASNRRLQEFCPVDLSQFGYFKK